MSRTPSRKLNRVRTLARTISVTVLLVRTTTSLVRPAATRSATCAEVSPVPGVENAPPALWGFSGLVIVVFGYSTVAWLSILALMLYGAFDMISVYLRETLMQLWIPDAVRGRVNAVNNVFIGASNQLGEARAGFVAAAIGAVPAVVIGGVGTIIVAGAWSYMFPKLRDARKLTGPS